MKKIGILICFLFLMFMCSCKEIELKRALLAAPQEARTLTKEEVVDEEFQSFLDKINVFSSELTEALVTNNLTTNVSISPVSVYFALSMAIESANGETLNGLLSLLDMSYEEVPRNTSKLYNYISKEIKTDRKVVSQLNVSNSVWLTEGIPYENEVIHSLADHYYAYPYQVDFANQNKKANQLIQEFVNDKTNGLVNPNFDLKEDTLLALINTLYFKDNWFNDGGKLILSDAYTCTNIDGSTCKRNLLMGSYRFGMVAEEEDYEHFYTKTAHDYEVRFILPKEGYKLEDVLTESTWNNVSTYEYPSGEAMTRCLFPAFEASYKENILSCILQLANLEEINFDRLVLDPNYCSAIQHVTKLKVDKEGIEGAAVTVMVGDKESAGPNVMKEYDFILDHAFGYVILTPEGVPLFTGAVTQF